MGHHQPQAKASKLPSAQQRSWSATGQVKSEMVDITSRTWASPILTPAPATSQLYPLRKLGNLSVTQTRVPLIVSVSFALLRGPSEAPGRWLPWGQPGVLLGVVPPSLGDPGGAQGGWPPPTLRRRLGKLPNGASVLKPAGGMPPSAMW